jgi:quercetin dioxygenase-like cupin family protein
MSSTLYPHWRSEITFAPDGPAPHVLTENDHFKVVLVGLEAGQKIPPHPEGASVFHFLDGNGWIVVDGERFAVQAGATVATSAGAKRGIEAKTRLAFLAVRAPM